MFTKNLNPYVKASIIAILVGLAVVPVWYIVGFYPTTNITDVAVAGQFGDSFGVATSLFSSFAFIAAMVAVIMQIIEQHESGENDFKLQRMRRRQLKLAQKTANLQNQMKEHETSQVVLKCLVSVNSEISHLREAWIDMSFHADLTEQRNARSRFESARQSLKRASFRTGMLFPQHGRDLSQLIESVLKITEDLNMNATATGVRESSLVAFLDVILHEISCLTLAFWEIQPIAIVRDFDKRSDDRTATVCSFTHLLSAINTMRQKLKEDTSQYGQNGYSENHPDAQRKRTEFLERLGSFEEVLMLRRVTLAAQFDDLNTSLIKTWEDLPAKWFGQGPVPNYSEACNELDLLFEKTLAHLNSVIQLSSVAN